MITKINWCDLPERTVIKLKDETQTKLLTMAISVFKKKGVLAEALGITRHHLNFYFKRKSNFTVKTLKRLIKILSISKSCLNDGIIEIGRINPIKNPRLPFDLHSRNGIILRSIVNSEGHIPIQVGTSMHIRVPEEIILNTVIKCCKNIFGDFKVEIKQTKGKNTKEIFLPSVIVDCLLLSGLTRGRKSIVNPSIPVDILKGDENIKKVYLQWSFVSEMEATRHVKLTRSVDITNLLPQKFIRSLKYGANFKCQISESILKIIIRKPNLLLGEIFLLKSFGINKSPKLKCLWKAKNGRVTAEWAIWITNKKEFKVLLYEIGIPDEKKSEKVKAILNGYKRDNILKQCTYSNTYKILYQLQNKNGVILRKDLVKAFNIKWADEKASRHLDKLMKNRIISRVRRGVYALSDTSNKI